MPIKLPPVVSDYGFTVDPRHVEEHDGQTVLTATVAGSFPGSPIELQFEFTIVDERIAALAIHA